MSEIIIDRRFTLCERRCYECGKFWACEDARVGTCPRCADARIAAAYKSSDMHAKTISRLRGVITRMKRKANP